MASGSLTGSDLAEPVDHAEIGESIGGYSLESLLGAGATSRVFLGLRPDGRKAAVKVLTPEMVHNEEVAERLLREARLVNDIRHPNIVEVYEFVSTEEPKRLALIMELVDGPRLGTIKRPLGFSLTVDLIQQLIAAVSAAHEAGVIHRDLKPDNLVLTRDPFGDVPPRLKVVDFGLAKVFGPLNKATGVMLGTPAYMAPEQIAGKPPPSPATDVFAIAEILFELLAGRRMYAKKGVQQIIREKLRGQVPEVKLPLDLPGHDRLEAMIIRGVAPKPEDRPPLTEIRDLLIEIAPGTAEEDTLEAPSVELAPEPTVATEVAAPDPKTAATFVEAAAPLPDAPVPAGPVPVAPARTSGLVNALLIGALLLVVGLLVALVLRFTGQETPIATRSADPTEAIQVVPAAPRPKAAPVPNPTPSVSPPPPVVAPKKRPPKKTKVRAKKKGPLAPEAFPSW